MAPMLFQEESVESLRARFPKALERVWIPTDPMLDRPGLHREHVFDFPTGLRLLISLDKLDGPVELHVSASWEHDGPRDLDAANIIVNAAYHMLGGEGTLLFIGFSNNGIPHWLRLDD